MEPKFRIGKITSHLILVGEHPNNMSVKTALKRSIAKWYYILKNKNEIKEDGGTNSCALCHLFFKDNLNQCRGCPVKKVTNQSCCTGSPYEEMELGESSRYGYSETFSKLGIPIRAEIQFLEELLRKENTKKKKKKVAA